MTRITNLPIATCIAALAVTGGPPALAGEHSLGVAASSYSISDTSTEEIFDVDSGPIPQLVYSFRDEQNEIVVSLGYASWDRLSSGPGGTVATELVFVPVVGAYRYYLRPERKASFFVGGGVGLMVYDAQAEGSGGFGFIATETGAMAALEPLAGVDLRAGRSVRFFGELKYSWQFLTADDLDLSFVVLDVDMSGFYATAGVSVRIGGE